MRHLGDGADIRLSRQFVPGDKFSRAEACNLAGDIIARDLGEQKFARGDVERGKRESMARVSRRCGHAKQRGEIVVGARVE